MLESVIRWRFDRMLTALLWFFGMKDFQVDQSGGECAVKFCLLLAHNQVIAGEEEDAERWMQRALTSAEITAGYESPLAGLVLIELFDLYDTQDRQDEAKVLWGRLRNIMRRYYPRHFH
jgi:hypothetical protein